MESSLKIAEIFVFFATIAAIIAYLFRFGFTHLFDVVIGREGLDIVVFRKIVIATIPYSSIERAERRLVISVERRFSALVDCASNHEQSWTTIDHNQT